MTIGLSVALNGRNATAEGVLAYYAGLALDGVVLHAVGSSDDDEAMAAEHGWQYTHAPNDNLGAKRNAGLLALQASGVAAVVRIGSDDYLAPSLLLRMLEALRSGARGVIVRGSFVVDDATGEVIELYRTDYALGIGAPVLDRYGWELYDTAPGSAPDHLISAYVSGADCHMLRSVPDAAFVQRKTAGSINTFERIKQREIWRPASLPVLPTPETEPAPAPRKRKAKPAEPEQPEGDDARENG